VEVADLKLKLESVKSFYESLSVCQMKRMEQFIILRLKNFMMLEEVSLRITEREKFLKMAPGMGLRELVDMVVWYRT
jgi:hypothetical protein